MSDETRASARKPAPKGLAGPGRRLWRDVVGAYGLRADELVLLESACRTTDFLSKLDAALVDAPLVVKGSMGQEREHPLLSERRQQSNHLARLFAQLKLPDDPEIDAGQNRSSQARAAARTRWDGRSPGTNSKWATTKSGTGA